MGEGHCSRGGSTEHSEKIFSEDDSLSPELDRLLRFVSSQRSQKNTERLGKLHMSSPCSYFSTQTRRN